jgi:hypothetical protein
MAVHATAPRQQLPSEIQLRGSGKGISVALAAGGLDIPGRQKRLFPSQRAAVRVFDCGCGTLTAVTHHAAKLIDGMRDGGMFAEGLRADIPEAGFFLSNVARRTTVYYAYFRKPDLLDVALKMALQG